MSAVPAVRPVFAPMTEQDVDAVAAAELRIYPFPWTRGNFADSLAAGYSCWLCLEGGHLTGYAVMMVAAGEAHLLNISIVPERQGRGIGGGFLSHLFSVARIHGAQRMFLEVRPSNHSGLALYRRFAFSEIGRRKAYYPAHGGREEAIVMARDL